MWRVWGDEFHAVSIEEKELKSTNSFWNTFEVWTSSSWLRRQEQQLHKGMEELPQQPLVAQEAAAGGAVPRPGLGTQCHCSGAGTGTGSRFRTVFSLRIIWKNGIKLSCCFWAKSLISSKGGSCTACLFSWALHSEICDERSFPKFSFVSGCFLSMSWEGICSQ